MVANHAFLPVSRLLQTILSVVEVRVEVDGVDVRVGAGEGEGQSDIAGSPAG